MGMLSALRRVTGAYSSDLRLAARFASAHHPKLGGHSAGSKLTAVVIAAVLAMPMLAPMPAAAATSWHAAAGAQSADAAVQVTAFLPTSLTIDVGDSMTWNFATTELHTVTLAAPPNTNNAEPQKCNGALSSTNQCVWDGVNEVNSGRMEIGDTYTVTFNTAGTFTFACLIHPTMTGTLIVQAAGTPYPQIQAFYDQQAATQAQQLVAQGTGVRTQTTATAAAAPADQVIAGANFAQSASLSGFVALFFAKTGSTTTVHAGETVAWLNPARTPHTVTFGPEPADPNTIVNATNGHATIGSDVSGGVSSGLFGVARPTGTVFSITFTAAGTFHYICALHDESGMVGTVVVLPANSGLGGKGFGVTPAATGTQLSWQSGTTQTGYALVRLSNGTFTILASLDRNATSYLDTTAPSGFNCYWLLALGAGPTGTSDLECATRGFQSATNVPQLFTLRLNQGGTATLEWAAPVESTQDGYTLVDFSGGKQQLGATATSATVPMSGFSCFAVQAKRAGAVVGTTEVLCAQPGLSNLGM